ncbi:MAG: hypothetical protein KDD94_08625, partial [Calditrichaeota bacterium]|nr:hypothetical protein [Calditrichota bacterium]
LTNSRIVEPVVFDTPDFVIGTVLIDSVEIKKVHLRFSLKNEGLGATYLYDSANTNGLKFRLIFASEETLNGAKVVSEFRYTGTDSVININDSIWIHAVAESIVDTAKFPYLGIDLDNDHLFDETNENNNISYQKIVITENDPYEPIVFGMGDFYISSMKIDNISSDLVTFTFSLKNLGPFAVNLEGDTIGYGDNAAMQHYYSAGDSLSAVKVAAGGYTYGQQFGETIILPNDSIWIHNTAHGTVDTLNYPYVRIDFDIGNRFPETNENNNVAFLRIRY